MGKTCKYCRDGNKPKQAGDGTWEHWIVKSIIPACITITDCKAPPEPKPTQAA